MPASKQVSGARAVYAVAAELSRLGLIASVTARNAKGADILVTDEDCRQAFSVQVKSSRTRQNWHWVIGKDLPVSDSHIFVFVYFPEKGEPDFYVVPSRETKRVRKDKDRKMPYVQKTDIAEYKDKWKRAFGLKTHR